jgi:hypothetical protein
MATDTRTLDDLDEETLRRLQQMPPSLVPEAAGPPRPQAPPRAIEPINKASEAAPASIGPGAPVNNGLQPIGQPVDKLAPISTLEQPSPKHIFPLVDSGLRSRGDEDEDSEDISKPPEIPAGPTGPAPSLGVEPIGPHDLNFKERQALPSTSPGVSPGSSGYYQGKIQKIEDEKANPWGSEENHPGFFGKLAHIGAKIGNIAGDVLDPAAMARIPGTELHRDLTEEAAGEDLGKAQTRETAEAGEKNREKHEENQADINQQKADLALDKAEEAQKKDLGAHEVALRKLGLKTNPDDPKGQPIPLTREDMSETEQAALDVKAAQVQGTQARAALDQIKADPNSPQNKATLERIRVMAQNASTSAGKLGLDKNKFMADYFGLGPDGNPLPGSPTDEKTGKPIGPRVAHGAAAENPGSERLKRSDLTYNTIHNGQQLQDIISRRPDLFGKFAGRFSTFNEAIGTDDKDLAQLAIIGHNYALASNGMHGVRSAEAVAKTEKDLLNQYRNSPEATIAAITAGMQSGQTFIDAANRGKKPLPDTQPNQKPAGATAGGAAGPPPPAGKVAVFSPEGERHFVNEGQADAFLKDPKYKGWHR